MWGSENEVWDNGEWRHIFFFLMIALLCWILNRVMQNVKQKIFLMNYKKKVVKVELNC